MMRRLLDRIADKLGYLPKSNMPNLIIETELGQPPFISFTPPGCDWRHRIAGYLYSTHMPEILTQPDNPLLDNPEK